MGKLMMVFASATISARFSGPFKSNDPSSIGDKSKVGNFEHDINPHGPIMGIARLAAKLKPGFRNIGFGNIYPTLKSADLFFGLPDTRKILIKFTAIIGTKVFIKGLGFGGDIIQDGFAFCIAF